MNYFLNQNTSYNSNGALIYNGFSKLTFQLTNGNYTIFILLMSSLSVFFFLASLIKLENDFINIFLSIYIYVTYYFYFDSFNMQRQMLAVSIAMYAVCLFIEGKNIKSVLLLLLAIGIHSTAFLALVNFFLVKVKKKGKYLTFLIFFVSILLIYYDKILQIFSIFFSHYGMYINSMNNSSLSAGGGVLFLGLFFIILSILTYFTVDIEKNNIFAFTLFSTVIGSVFYIIGRNSQLIIRIANYLLIFVTVFMPVAIREISSNFLEKKMVRTLGIFIIMTVGIAIMYYKLSNNFAEVVPYSTSF
jgi:hypothetical protein